MCNPTMQPPRREMYELTQTLTAEKPKTAENGSEPTGSFLLPANRRIRVGAGNNPQRAQVYNAEYMSDGTHYAKFDKPWTAFTAIDFRTFKTHAEAIAWVLQEARK